MKLKTLSLCALLLMSMVFVALPEPATSYEEFPELPPQPFTESPDFGSYGANPDTGWNDTTFSFWLNFSSDEEPVNISVRVYVDNIPYDMFENNTKDLNWSDGKDYYWMNEERLWSKGNVPYFFYVEINDTDNITETNYFEIYNRAPYILSPPPFKMYVDEVVTYQMRIQDDDLDPIDGEVAGHNFTLGADWWWWEWWEENLTFMGKPKREWVRWINITIWDPYDQIAWYRWTIVCTENEGGDSMPPSPKGDLPFPSGEGDPQITPTDSDPRPEPLTNSFLDLDPNAEGHELDWTPKGGGDHYVEVDDGNGTHDDDTTYISVTSGNAEDYWLLEDHTSESGTISNVRLSLRVKHSAGGEEFAFALANGSVEYVGSDVQDTTSWVTYTEDHATNPITSGDWYWGDIDYLQLGIKSRAIGGFTGTEYCTSGWITVTYEATAPPPTTIFYWTGDGNSYEWDDFNNWVVYAAGSYSAAGAGVYPNANDDEAHINETANTIYLKDGANSVVTIGNLTLESGFTGTLNLSVDLIVDNAGHKNGNITINAGTFDTNGTANNQVNLDGNLTISATIDEQEGIFVVQGAQTQKIRVTNSQKLYKLTTDTASTVGELYDNLTAFQITIGTGTTFKIDSATRGYTLYTKFTDVATCGFVSTSAGTLQASGSATYGVTITTADASPPPTNYWLGFPSGNGDGVTLHNATLSYGTNMGLGWNDPNTISNLTVDYFTGTYGLYIRTPPNTAVYRDITISNTGAVYGLLIGTGAVQPEITNLVISSFSGTNDINVAYGATGEIAEFMDSNFDATNVRTDDSAHANAWTSQTHNDVANAYKLGCRAGYSFSKSTITNDWGTGDNLEIVSGVHILDENGAAETIEIDSGATFQVGKTTPDANITLTFDDASGAGFDGASSGTLKVSGSATYYGMNITSENTPPTNHWRGGNNPYSVDISYANLSYFNYFDASGTSVTITNTTFYEAEFYTTIGRTVPTTFSDNIMDGEYLMVITNDVTNIENLTVQNTPTYDLRVINVRAELVDSGLSTAKTWFSSTSGAIISDNHNDVADDYKILVKAGTSLSKSTITNDFTTGDNIELVSGKFIMDEDGQAQSIATADGTTWQIGKDTPDASITLTFDDYPIASLGFTEGDFYGTLIMNGTTTYPHKITSENTPPTTKWKAPDTAWANPFGQIHIHNSTLEYYQDILLLGKETLSTVSNLTLNHCTGICAFPWFPINGSFFNDIQLNDSHGTDAMFFEAGYTHLIVKNLTITNSSSTNDWGMSDTYTGYSLEFIDSTFDENKLSYNDIVPDLWISKNHNDTSGRYLVATEDSCCNASKSYIQNDWGASDTVELLTGILTIDENSEQASFFILSGSELEIGSGITFDTSGNFTNNGTLESWGTITDSGGYFDFYNTNPGGMWFNNSTVSNAKLAYYHSGFNFTIGNSANSTINEWTLETPVDAQFNITYYDFNNKGSGVIWHMNVTAASGSVKFVTSNLTSGETYRSYVESVLHTEGNADSGDYYNFSYSGWSTKHIYLIWGASGPTPDIPGPGQWDSWKVGFSYSKHPFTNEVRLTAIFRYDYNASIYIWTFGDGSVIETTSPNLTRNFAFSIYSTESVKLTIVATDGNRYWMESPIILDNSLWIALLCLTIISFAAIAIIHTRKERREESLIMVEVEG